MSEINKNSINNKIVNTRNDISFKGVNNKVSNEKDETLEVPSIDNLGNNPSEALGRSQVKHPKTDSINLKEEVALQIKNDLDMLKNNPKLIAKSDKVFDNALKAAKNDNNIDPYAHAVAIQTHFVEEFATV